MKNFCVCALALLVLGGCASAGQDVETPQPAEVETPQSTSTLPFTVEPVSRPAAPQSMTNESLNRILQQEVQNLERQGPVWMFEFRDVVMVVVSDEPSDRMRIVAPIAPFEELPDPRIVFVLMEANFHTALDARYATSEGVVYSTFIHPLSSLNDESLVSAMIQVSNLVRTFGTTFSAVELEPRPFDVDVTGY